MFSNCWEQPVRGIAGMQSSDFKHSNQDAQSTMLPATEGLRGWVSWPPRGHRTFIGCPEWLMTNMRLKHHLSRNYLRYGDQHMQIIFYVSRWMRVPCLTHSVRDETEYEKLSFASAMLSLRCCWEHPLNNCQASGSQMAQLVKAAALCGREYSWRNWGVNGNGRHG